MQKIEECLSIIENEIKARKGTFKLLTKARIIGANENDDLDDIRDRYKDPNQD